MGVRSKNGRETAGPPPRGTRTFYYERSTQPPTQPSFHVQSQFRLGNSSRLCLNCSTKLHVALPPHAETQSFQTSQRPISQPRLHLVSLPSPPCFLPQFACMQAPVATRKNAPSKTRFQPNTPLPPSPKVPNSHTPSHNKCMLAQSYKLGRKRNAQPSAEAPSHAAPTKPPTRPQSQTHIHPLTTSARSSSSAGSPKTTQSPLKALLPQQFPALTHSSSRVSNQALLQQYHDQIFVTMG